MCAQCCFTSSHLNCGALVEASAPCWPSCTHSFAWGRRTQCTLVTYVWVCGWVALLWCRKCAWASPAPYHLPVVHASSPATLAMTSCEGVLVCTRWCVCLLLLSLLGQLYRGVPCSGFPWALPKPRPGQCDHGSRPSVAHSLTQEALVQCWVGWVGALVRVHSSPASPLPHPRSSENGLACPCLGLRTASP